MGAPASITRFPWRGCLLGLLLPLLLGEGLLAREVWADQSLGRGLALFQRRTTLAGPDGPVLLRGKLAGRGPPEPWAGGRPPSAGPAARGSGGLVGPAPAGHLAGDRLAGPGSPAPRGPVMPIRRELGR